MAAICPNRHLPEMIAYVVNDGGLHPFPCLECTGTGRCTPYGHLSGAAPCGTDGCQGSVRDDYQYDPEGRLSRLDRVRCRLRATDSAAVPPARSAPERAVPGPRPPGSAMPGARPPGSAMPGPRPHG
ncbi:hypothetical protein [Streptomyces rubradiris]|uniref:YD repeat-containing protein n=1 Tax=Streptomyces rubradiris TaxID=285531 RepID=A0ABQ3RE62_STRRR|nr:hypothetical protein [Streptomyces rubradiris]GHH28660.1 hypothetical protein GCM10018792_72650 [Streptomyces rubradiris]GHI54148.1 hypothetical protein Srubr_39940 [Streptomyces rubradiris]